MWILGTVIFICVLFFLIPSSKNYNNTGHQVKPENKNKPATKRQIEYLKTLPCAVRIEGPDSKFMPDEALDLIRKRVQKKIDSGINREQASALIEALKSGYYGPDKILEALSISRWEINKYI